MSLRPFGALVCLLLPFSLVAQKKPVTLDAVSSSRPVDAATAPQWSPDGRRFVYRQNGKLFLYDVAAKSAAELATLKDIESAARKPPAPPVMNWENRRVVEMPVQWAKSGRELLLSLNGDIFLFDIDTKKWDQLTATPVDEADPKLSPDGRKVSFRRSHDLYVLNVSDKAIKQLTHDGSATLWNAELDWVYPEELELGTAHWWAPDSKHIAYLQFDVGREPLYPHADFLKMDAVAEPQRYPKAGTPNADVRVGVVPAAGGRTHWMDLGETRDRLLARLKWSPDSIEVWVQQLNRVQNQLDLSAVNITTGKPRPVLRETDPAWVNLGDDPVFLNDGDFLWTSERSGYRHIYRYSPSGALKAPITGGNWEITAVHGVDETAGRAYFTATEASPLERQLYSVPLAGGPIQRITRAKGTHSISMAAGAAHYVDTFSGLTEPSRRALFQSNGAELAVLREADRKPVEEYEILPSEIVEVKAPDGATMYARLIRPAKFDASRKYPAIVMVYGGPHAQSVRDAWSGLSWDQALAHQGFVIWQLDNRGSSGRGHKWEIRLYRRFGKQELEDQKTGVEHLVKMGFVDPARIGIHGWSYGGFMTLYALLNAPDIFRAGVAGAPVTDWRNYDTIYTERYLGLPTENEDGYRLSSPVTHAANLKGRLMMVHNIEDDNVLFANAMMMSDVLQKAGKQFEFQVYPQKAHGVSGAVRKQMLETITAFFEKTLK